MKNYRAWHQLKFLLNNGKLRVYFHESEVWFCHLGENIGFEQDGKGKSFLRPVMILKKFNNRVFWAIPLTKTEKEGKYYFSLFFKNSKSVAILSQLRLMDVKRLKYKAGSVRKKDFVKIKEKIKQLLD